MAKTPKSNFYGDKLEKKLTAPFDVQFSKPVAFEKDGLKWQEMPVTLKARDAGHILHWAWGKIAHDFSTMSVPSKGRIPIDHVHSDDALGYIDEFDVSDGLLLKGKLVLTEGNNLALDIATKIAAGVPYQSSIFFDDLENGKEYTVQKVDKHKSDTVNGQVFPSTSRQNRFLIHFNEPKTICGFSVGGLASHSSSLVYADCLLIEGRASESDFWLPLGEIEFYPAERRIQYYDFLIDRTVTQVRITVQSVVPPSTGAASNAAVYLPPMQIYGE